MAILKQSLSTATPHASTALAQPWLSCHMVRVGFARSAECDMQLRALIIMVCVAAAGAPVHARAQAPGAAPNAASGAAAKRPPDKRPAARRAPVPGTAP